MLIHLWAVPAGVLPVAGTALRLSALTHPV